ncbi:hypothetical protein N6147_001935 [Proteus mirabilis]|nr:hypothetical protein [Proteus mirabilis]
MILDTIDVELYLKKQAICGRMKFTNFMKSGFVECMTVAAILCVALYGILLCFCYFSTNLAEGVAEFISFMPYVAATLSCYLIFIAMFFAGGLPRYNAMLSVEDIKQLFVVFNIQYDEMSSPPANSRSAIEYLSTVINSGIALDVTHANHAQKLLRHDIKADELNARSANAADVLLKTSRLINVSSQPQANHDMNISEVSGKIPLVNKTET